MKAFQMGNPKALGLEGVSELLLVLKDEMKVGQKVDMKVDMKVV